MTAYRFQTVERVSAFSRMDFRTKLVLMLVVTLLAFVWEDPLLEFGLAMALLAAAVAAGVKKGYLALILAGMAPFYMFMILTHAFFNVTQVQSLLHRDVLTPIFQFPVSWWLVGGGGASWEGLLYGLNIVFKTMSLTLVLPLAIFTTDVDEMITSMVHARLPFKVAFIFSSTLRFFPLLWAEFNKIVEAQRLRGLALESMGLVGRVRVYARVAVPLILGALMRSQQLEVVLQARAFDGSPDRTYFHEVHLRRQDYVWIVVLLLILIGAVIGRIGFGWGEFSVWF